MATELPRSPLSRGWAGMVNLLPRFLKPDDETKRKARRALRRIKRLVGIGGIDPLGEPGKADKWMEDRENMTPYCRLAGRLKLTVREATLILQMLEDMDEEGSGLLSGGDVYAYFNVEAPDLAKSCLLADALLHRERLEYHEMFMSLYNFCTLPVTRLGDYVFQVMDELGGGSIEREAVLEALPRIHSKATPEDLETITRRVRKTIATTRTGTVTLDDWRRVQKRNPGVLLPIAQARRRLVNAFMGPRFWHDRSEERFRIFDDIDQPGFIVVDMLDAVVTKRPLELVGSPRSTDNGEEEQDPHELDFETPREEAREEAYHHDMAVLIHEKRRIAQAKKTVLQRGKEAAEDVAAKVKAEAKRLKEEAERLKVGAVRMRDEAAIKLRAEALRLKEEAAQAAERMAQAAKERLRRTGGEEGEEEEEDGEEEDDEMDDAAQEQMQVIEFEGEEEVEEGPPVQRTGDWWTTIDERRPTPPRVPEGEEGVVEMWAQGEEQVEEAGSSRPGSREAPELLLIGEDLANVIRHYYEVKAEGLALLASVSETEAANAGQEGQEGKGDARPPAAPSGGGA